MITLKVEYLFIITRIRFDLTHTKNANVTQNNYYISEKRDNYKLYISITEFHFTIRQFYIHLSQCSD